MSEADKNNAEIEKEAPLAEGHFESADDLKQCCESAIKQQE